MKIFLDTSVFRAKDSPNSCLGVFSGPVRRAAVPRGTEQFG